MGGPRKGGGTKSWNFSGGAKGWDTIFDSNLVGGGGGGILEKTMKKHCKWFLIGRKKLKYFNCEDIELLNVKLFNAY